MSKIEELYKMVNSFPYEKREEILEALSFLNQPIDDYVLKNYLDLEDLKNEHMLFDVFSHTYKGKSISDYEDKRKRALMRISSTENILEDIIFAVREMAEIKEGIHGIHYNEMFKSCCQIAFMIEVCRNMMLQGASLAEISKYVPGSQMGDIYRLARNHLGIDIKLSEEEKDEVERYDKMLADGTQKKANLRDIMRWTFLEGIPHKQADGSGWSVDGKEIYDVHKMACVFAECQISFPYYFGNKTNPAYAETFDELLEKIMLKPDQVSFYGLEKAYSTQEWNLIHRLQEKILRKQKEG